VGHREPAAGEKEGSGVQETHAGQQSDQVFSHIQTMTNNDVL
jgi:hypothetical protein